MKLVSVQDFQLNGLRQKPQTIANFLLSLMSGHLVYYLRSWLHMAGFHIQVIILNYCNFYLSNKNVLFNCI